MTPLPNVTRRDRLYSPVAMVEAPARKTRGEFVRQAAIMFAQREEQAHYIGKLAWALNVFRSQAHGVCHRRAGLFYNCN